MPSQYQYVWSIYICLKNSRSTSRTLWSKICFSTLGSSSSFSILLMTLSASSRCCLALTWPS